MKQLVFGIVLFFFLGTTSVFAELPSLTVTTTANKALLSSTLDSHSNTAQLWLCYRSTTPYQPSELPCGESVRSTVSEGGALGIGSDGAFTFVLTGLTPSKKYYYAYYLMEGNTLSDSRLFPEGFVAGTGIQTEEQVQKSFDERSYRLLSPLPGLAVLYDPDLCTELIDEGKLPANYGPCNREDPSGFGWFINYVFQFLIGICAVLLVIRIMIEGYKYMTSDIPFLKVGAKAKLGESFAGLALALAAYLLLNTINPRLVSQSIEVEGVNVGVDNEIEFTPIGDNSNTTLPRGGTSLCPEGVIRVEGTTFVACRPIAANIKRMVEDARRVGISLSGGGYRSVDSQIALRKQNCGSSSYDIYQKLSNRCRPPTARPGASMHQSGKAFDIICNGVGFINVANRPNTRTCFDWLRTNASRYGLYNLPSENWHWSTTGR